MLGRATYLRHAPHYTTVGLRLATTSSMAKATLTKQQILEALEYPHLIAGMWAYEGDADEDFDETVIWNPSDHCQVCAVGAVVGRALFAGDYDGHAAEIDEYANQSTSGASVADYYVEIPSTPRLIEEERYLNALSVAFESATFLAFCVDGATPTEALEAGREAARQLVKDYFPPMLEL